MNQTSAREQDDLFATKTAGLPEVARPGLIRLHDGGRLDLRIGAVRKRIGGAELRMLGYNGSVPGPLLHVDQGSQTNQAGLMFSFNVARDRELAR